MHVLHADVFDDQTSFLHRKCMALMGTLPEKERSGLQKKLHEKMDYAWANLASKEGHSVVRRALAEAVEKGIDSDDVAVWAVSSDFGNTDTEREQRELNAHDCDPPAQSIADFVSETYNILIVWSLTSLVVLTCLLFCAAYYLLKASMAIAKRVKNKTCVSPKCCVEARKKKCPSKCPSRCPPRCPSNACDNSYEGSWQ